jgi:hypothetical protein
MSDVTQILAATDCGQLHRPGAIQLVRSQILNRIPALSSSLDPKKAQWLMGEL